MHLNLPADVEFKSYIGDDFVNVHAKYDDIGECYYVVNCWYENPALGETCPSKADVKRFEDLAFEQGEEDSRY